MRLPAHLRDSPWFWMLAYSTVPLVGLAMLSQKYGQRQARLERQYQGHVAAAEKKSQKLAGASTAKAQTPVSVDGAVERTYSSAENTIIPLAPLVLIFLAVACFAGVMLAREQLLRKRESTPASPSGGNAAP
jgi:hypothetical protein